MGYAFTTLFGSADCHKTKKAPHLSYEQQRAAKSDAKLSELKHSIAAAAAGTDSEGSSDSESTSDGSDSECDSVVEEPAVCC